MVVLKQTKDRLGFWVPIALLLISCLGCSPGVNFAPERQEVDLYPFSTFYFDETGKKTFPEAKEIQRAGGFKQMKSMAGYRHPGVFWVHLSINPSYLVQASSDRVESHPISCELCLEKDEDTRLVAPNECGLCLITNSRNTNEFTPTFRVIDAYYTTSTGKIIHRKSGAHANTNETTEGWGFSQGCFPISDFCPENQQISIYLRLVMMYDFKAEFYGSITSYQQEHYRWASILSQRPLLIGFRLMVSAIIFYIFIYSMIQYSQIQDNSYLLYGLYIFLSLAYDLEQNFMGDTGLYNSLLSVREWHYYFEVPLAASTFISYILFIVVFLNIKDTKPKAYFWAKFGIGFALLLIVIDLITRQIGGVYLSMRWYKYDRIPLILINLPLFYHIFKREKGTDNSDKSSKTQKKLGLIIGIGSALLLLGVILSASIVKPYILAEKADGMWDQNNPLMYPRTYMQLGFLTENIVLLIGLAYKSRIQFAELRERISAQSRKIETIADSIETSVEFRFIAHSLKNIRQSLSNFGESRQKTVAEYYEKMIGLVEKWYQKSQNNHTHSLKSELRDMQTWISLNNLIVSPHIHVKVEGGEILEEDFPLSVVGMLLPFVENSIIHGFNKQKQILGPRILSFQIREDINRGYYLIQIEDNGVGFDKGNKGSISTGIEIARKRLEKIGGGIDTILDLNVEGLHGTRVILSLPNT